MSDEAPAPAQETPEQPAPTGTPGESQIDWQKRYEDLRPQFDRTAQEAAALRAEQERLNDEEYFRQLMVQRGYEVEEPDPGFTDPNAAVLERLERIEQAEQQRQQEAAQAAQLRVLEQSVNEQFTAIPDLNPADREWVEDRALTRLPPREDGMPDVQAAYQALVERDNRLLSERAKRRKSAPTFAAGGKEGTQAPDMGDDDTRRAYMAARFGEMDTA